MHAATLGIFIDVANHENEAGDHHRDAGDNPEHCQGSQHWLILEVRSKDIVRVVSKLVGKNYLSDSLGQDVQHEDGAGQPARHEFELIPEAQIFLFAAKTDQPDFFVEGIFKSL